MNDFIHKLLDNKVIYTRSFMKKLIALTGLLFLSFGTHADSCRTEMVDDLGYVKLIFAQPQPSYMDPYCWYGYQWCLNSLAYNSQMRPSCRVMRFRPTNQPQYSPRPSPTQPPRTSQAPRLDVDMTVFDASFVLTNRDQIIREIFDGQRKVEMGETVFMKGTTYRVVGAKNSVYEVQPETSNKKKDILKVSRDQIAVTRGCTLNVCVTDPVYNVPRGRMEAVAGITTLGEIVTKNEETGKLNEGPVRLKEIALGKGCVYNRSNQEVCVGNTVQNRNHVFMEVVAIQHDRKLVVRQTEGSYSSMKANIEAADLVVVK